MLINAAGRLCVNSCVFMCVCPGCADGAVWASLLFVCAPHAHACVCVSLPVCIWQMVNVYLSCVWPPLWCVCVWPSVEVGYTERQAGNLHQQHHQGSVWSVLTRQVVLLHRTEAAFSFADAVTDWHSGGQVEEGIISKYKTAAERLSTWGYINSRKMAVND